MFTDCGTSRLGKVMANQGQTMALNSLTTKIHTLLKDLFCNFGCVIINIVDDDTASSNIVSLFLLWTIACCPKKTSYLLIIKQRFHCKHSVHLASGYTKAKYSQHIHVYVC